MDPEVTIPVDPNMTGPEPAAGEAPPEAPETPDVGASNPPASPSEDVESEAPEQPAEAAPAKPVEFSLPDGTKATAEQIAQWKAGAMMEADYRRKTQELADQRRQLDEQRQAREAEERVRQEAARQANVIDPITAADRWKQTRYGQYVEHYKAQGRDPQEIDWRDIEMDHMAATQRVMLENQQKQAQSLTERERQADVERQTMWLDRTIDQQLARDEYKLANTPEGQEDVRAHLAATLHANGEITAVDIEAAVKKVHSRAHAYVSKYVNGKQSAVDKTSGIARGGGQSRAPERKKYPAELSSIRDLSNDLERSGG